MRHLIPLLMAAIAPSAGAVVAAELTLDDGRTIAGEVVAETGGQIRLRIPLATATAELSFANERVVRIDLKGGQREIAQLTAIAAYEAANRSTTEPDWSALSAIAKSAGLPTLMRRCAESLVMTDRSREDAAKTAGLVLHRGVWMRPTEVAAATGMIAFEGRWVSWNQRETELAERARVTAAQLEAQRLLVERFRADEYRAQAARTITQPPYSIGVYPSGSTYGDNSCYRSLWWSNNRYSPAWGQPNFAPALAGLSLQGNASWGNGSVQWRLNW